MTHHDLEIGEEIGRQIKREFIEPLEKRIEGYEALTAEQAKQIDGQQREIAELEKMQMEILVAYYRANSADCARYCDEILDPSGNLLGRVRDAVDADDF